MPAFGHVTAAIGVALPGLVPSDARVAQIILDEPTRVVELSVSELAELAGTAASTVVHACKRLGFKGFQDLKLALARDLGRAQGVDHAELPDEPSPDQVFDVFMRRSIALLQNSLVTVDREAFNVAADRIAAARQILCVAMGSSTWIAQQLAHDFNVIGRVANAPMDLMHKQLLARQLGPGDACVVISHPGTSVHGLETAEIAKAQGAFIVGVTSFQSSPLTKISDVALVAGGHELGLTLGHDISRIAHVAVLRALHLAVGLRIGQSALDGYDRAAEININHHL